MTFVGYQLILKFFRQFHKHPPHRPTQYPRGHKNREFVTRDRSIFKTILFRQAKRKIERRGLQRENF